MAALQEPEYISRLLEDPNDEGIASSFEMLMKHVETFPEFLDLGLFSDLPTSVVEIITNKHSRKILCDYCISGKNLIIIDGVLTGAFCPSCRAQLSKLFPCSSCGDSRWINELGQPSKLCKRCFADKKISVPVLRKGDWVCSRCKNQNFSFRLTCNFCDFSRSEKLQESCSIHCGHCGYINYSNRQNCHNCSSPL